MPLDGPTACNRGTHAFPYVERLRVNDIFTVLRAHVRMCAPTTIRPSKLDHPYPPVSPYIPEEFSAVLRHFQVPHTDVFQPRWQNGCAGKLAVEYYIAAGRRAPNGP